MLTHGNKIVKWVEQLAPQHLAMPDDRIGLQLGTLNKQIKHVLIALEVTDEVVAEAIANDVDLIIAHHAVMFRPLEHLRTDTPGGQRLATMIKHDIAVYVAHTNLDVAVGGVNDLLAEALGLQHVTFLDKVHEDLLYKLIVFVPKSHQEAVQAAMFNVGAGQIGRYSHCSFNIDGIGTFMPQEGTNPYSGQQGSISREAEVRIETIVPQSKLSKVVDTMIEAHPYEEVAYDIYQLQLPGQQYGIGRIGVLTGEVDHPDWTLGQLASHVKAKLDVPMLRIVGDTERKVSKVAIVGGSGSRYVRHAIAARADVLITGDIDYHTAHDALAAGLALIDPGHNVERILKPSLASYIQDKLKGAGSTTRVMASQVDTEPFRFM